MQRRVGVLFAELALEVSVVAIESQREASLSATHLSEGDKIHVVADTDSEDSDRSSANSGTTNGGNGTMTTRSSVGAFSYRCCSGRSPAAGCSTWRRCRCRRC